MKECVVYHWWSHESDGPVARNQRTPIITSIATLRACNANIPIYILDGSESPNDLGDFESILNFKVIPCKFQLREGYSDKLSWRNLSRLFDIKNLASSIEEETIIYSDTDIFWIADPIPLVNDGSKFCFNGYNSGYFYYNKKSITPKFFELFEAYTITALNDEAFRYITWQYSTHTGDYFVLDEALLCYMWHKHPLFFDKIDLAEHGTLSSIYDRLDLSPVKMIHANGISVKNKLQAFDWKRNHARGILPLVIKECYQKLASVISLEKLYTTEEIDYYVPLQVNLNNPRFLQILNECRNQDNLLDLMAAINLFHQVH